MNSKKICLLLLDGWGIGEKNMSNPIAQAKLPHIDEIKSYYPFTSLQASGIAIGLPWQEEGNSEVGHLAIGAGRIIYQYYPRINMAIDDGSFFTNPAISSIFQKAKEKNTACHIIGLLTSGNVHSAYNHIVALIDAAKKNNIKNLRLHLFTDGRDAPPNDGLELIKKLQTDLKNRGVGKVASLCGRFYGMDHEENWGRLQRFWNLAIKGEGAIVSDPEQYLIDSYKKEITDEFIEPVLIVEEGQDKNWGTIKENDSVFFFNFREDGIKQILEPFIKNDFNKFPALKPANLYISSMTEIDLTNSIPVAFPKQIVEHSLSQVLSENGKRQLHLAESAKYAHATYFFNGLKEKPYSGEYWVIVPSAKTLHHEENIELMAPVITERLCQAMDEKIYDFIFVNYANADLIGHTGNFDAAISCAEFLDGEIGKVMAACQKNDVILIITADHGNVEKMMDPFTGRPQTQHDISPVPFYLIHDQFKLANPRSPEMVNNQERSVGGVISDIAPTILKIFDIPIPTQMNGHNLLPIVGVTN